MCHFRAKTCWAKIKSTWWVSAETLAPYKGVHVLICESLVLSFTQKPKNLLIWGSFFKLSLFAFDVG